MVHALALMFVILCSVVLIMKNTNKNTFISIREGGIEKHSFFVSLFVSVHFRNELLCIATKAVMSVAKG